MPGNYSINAEDLRLATNPALEVDNGGLRVKVAGADLERVAGGLRIAAGAVDGNAGLQGGGGTAISLKLSNRMEFSAGALRSKVKPNEGLGGDAAGYFVDKTQPYNWTGQHDYGVLPPTVGADPAVANHLTRRSWVLAQIDLAKNNFDIKDSVRLATAGVLPAYTRSLNGGVTRLTADANGALSVDGVAAANGNRVLVLKETAGNAPWNGIYVVTDAGSGGTPFILDRAADADSPTEFTPGLFVGVEEGQTLAKSRWVMTTAAPFTLDVSAANFARYDAGTMQAGAGMTRTNDQFDVVAADGSLQVNADSVQVRLDNAPNPTLLVGGGGIKVKNDATRGLALDANGLFVGLADASLEYSAGNVRAKLSANKGLSLDGGNGLQVNVDNTSVQLNGGNLKAKLSANKGLAEDGANGLQVLIDTNTMLYSGGSLKVKLSANKGIVEDAANGLKVNVADELTVDGGGVVRLVLDGGTLVKGPAGVKVADNGIGPTQIDETAGYTWTGQHLYSNNLRPQCDTDPSSANDLARRSWILAQIDVAKNNFDVKDSVRAATAAALPAYTRSLNGGVTRLTGNANGQLFIDTNVNVNIGNRVLVKNEVGGNAPWNGIYEVVQPGDAGTPYILDRAKDADSNAEFTTGLFCSVDEGQTLAGSRWVCTAVGINLDTTNITFARYDAGTIQGGAGLARNGDVIDVLLEAANPSLQVVGDELGIKFDANGGLQKGANGTSIKLEANKGLGTTGSGLKVVEDPNGGVLVDASGVGIKVDTTGSGRVQKTNNGVRVVSGGLGLPVSFRTEEYAASTFTYNAGPNLSTHNVNATPSVHANIIEAQALLKNGADTMIRVAGAPANANEWRLNGNVIEIFGDVTQVGGDKYRVRYATDV